MDSNPSSPTTVMALKTSNNRAHPTFLGYLFQCFTILMVKYFFLMSSLSQRSLSFNLLSLVLPLLVPLKPVPIILVSPL